MLGWHYAHLLVKTSHVTWNSPSEWFISAREHYCKGHHCTFSWPRVHFVWILLLLLCLITNSFTCLVQSKPVKQVVSCTEWYSPNGGCSLFQHWRLSLKARQKWQKQIRAKVLKVCLETFLTNRSMMLHLEANESSGKVFCKIETKRPVLGMAMELQSTTLVSLIVRRVDNAHDQPKLW